MTTSVAGSPQVYDIDLHADSLADALTRLSEETGTPVVFSYDLVRSHKANVVVGRYTVQEALDALLKDSGLSGGLSEKGVLMISTSRASAPQPGETLVTNDKNGPNTNKNTAGHTAGVAALLASLGAAFSVSAAEDANEAPANNVAEVIVSAQKKDERLQDVPVPITVLDTQVMAQNNQTRVQDYFATVPGLSFTGGGGEDGNRQYVTMRGLSTSSGSTPSVAFLIDDVPIGSSTESTLGQDFFPDLDPSDLARVEVLKGPQGTLYGADSIGGIIKLVTQDPSTSAFSAHVQAIGEDIPDGSAGWGFRGAVNMPISDTIAVRASAFTRHDPGYVDNLTTRRNDVNVVNSHGGRVAVLWKPIEDLSLKLSALVQNTYGYGSPTVDSNATFQPVLGDLNQTALAGTGTFTHEVRLYTAAVNAKLAGIDLVSITGYNINSTHDILDLTKYFSGIAFKYFGVTGSAYPESFEPHKFTQELRLSSSVGSWMSWLFGGFYTYERSPNTYQNIYANDAVTGAYVGGLDLQSFDPAQTFAERAVFGDVTFHITDQFDLQIGGRESWNSQTHNYRATGAAVLDFEYAPSPFTEPEQRVSGNAFTYLFTPEYKISHDLMVYSRIASGYRVGGANFTTVGNIPDGYKPDKTDNYELGIKGDFADHRLTFDGSLYYIKWHDIQIYLQNQYNGYIGNGGRARSEGFEWSVQTRPAEGLQISLSGSINKAELTQDLPSNSSAYALSGSRLPYSSRFTGSLSVEQDLLHLGEVTTFLGGTLSYVGERFGEFAGSPTQNRFVYPGYATINAHAGARYGTWMANLFVNNAANRRGLLGGGNGATIDSPGYYAQILPPRTIGLSLSKDF